ncbi:endothelin-converting enzyme 1, partial [Plakobranchus ocellatus]
VDPDPPPPPPEQVPPTVAVTQPVTPIPADAPPPRQGCMAKRSCLEKALLVLIIIIIIICILCAAAFLIYFFFSSAPEGTCLSENCVNAASRLKSYMNDEVNPCNDFYEYACGKWMKTKVLEPTEDRLDTFTAIKEAYKVKMKVLLEETIGQDDPAYKTQPRTFYKACMNLGRIEDRDTEPFMEFLATIGKFPTLETAWNETHEDFSLEQMIIRLAKIGVTPLFSIMIDRDWKNPDANRLYIGDAMLGLRTKEAYKDGRKSLNLEQREKWLVDTLVLLGADKETAEKDVGKILDLEISLSKLMRDPIEKENRDARYNLETIRLLNSEFTWLNWLEVFQGIGANPEKGSVLIDDEEQIINQEPQYLEKLGELLKTTDNRIIANFMMSSLLKYTAWLGEDFRHNLEQYLKVSENEPSMERWEQCTKQATEIYPEAVSRMFVEAHFPKESKEKIDAIVKDLRNAFSSMVAGNTWMSEEAIEKARDKLGRMEAKVAYPDYLMDDERLNSLYEDIPADELKYLETLAEYRKFKTLMDLQKVRERPDRKEWISAYPASVDYGYDQVENEIIVPAAFLQPPIFSPEYPYSMNFGAAGMWIGRDITKAIDKQGSRYDAQGDLKPWWSDRDKEGYAAQSTCFIDQYGCYKWEGNSIDGELTLGENVADNGGLKQSYKAYRAMIKREGTEEQRLPGLDLNHNQIFFLSFAQTWCAQIRDTAKKSIVETGPHAPHPYRVFGSLQNTAEFAEAYNCQMGSRMNPMRKCRMW